MIVLLWRGQPLTIQSALYSIFYHYQVAKLAQNSNTFGGKKVWTNKPKLILVSMLRKIQSTNSKEEMNERHKLGRFALNNDHVGRS